MIVNQAAIQGVYRSLNALFNKAFTEAPSTWEKIAMKIPSPSGEEDYLWLSEFPELREWIGEKHIKALKGQKYTISSKDYESTIGVKRKHLERDQLGIYKPRIETMGVAAKEHYDVSTYKAVNGAFTNLCYDGKPFCATNHLVGNEDDAVAVSNKGTAPLSDASRTAADASFGAGFTAMEEFKNDDGRGLNIRPSILLVPPALRIIGTVLTTHERLADDTPNPYRGLATLVVDGRLTSRTAWFLLDVSRPVKPFIYQETKAPHLVSQTDPQSDSVFLRGEYLYGVEAEGNSGYGFWQLCYGSTGLGS